MKKAIAIIVLGLLFCNTVFAKQTALSCTRELNKGKISTHSIIINDDDQTLIFNGDSSNKIEKWDENIILFDASNKTKTQIEIEQTLEEIMGSSPDYRLDRITGYLNGSYKCEVVTKPKF